jgi:acyl-coenzyme A synthetase/AMP-(fatty) acid ligase
MTTAFVEQLFHHSQSRSAALALTTGNAASLSYAELWLQATTLAAALKAHASDKDFVFVLSHRNQYQVIAIVASLIAGVPLAIIDLRQGLARVASMLSQGKALLGLVDNAGKKLLDELYLEGHAAAVSQYYCLEEPILVPATPVLVDGIGVNYGAESTKVVLPKDTAVILFTSGSTGHPKGVCVSAADLDQRCRVEQEWFVLSADDAVLGVLPLNFDVGLMQLLGSLYAGAHHVLASSWLPADIIKTIERWCINGLAMSPMVWRSLLKTKDHQQLFQVLNRLRYVTLSGGTLDVATLGYIVEQLTSACLIKTYGQTEMFRIASLKVKAGSRLDSVGPAYTGVTIRIEDESGSSLPVGLEGEVVARGLGCMGGYINDAIFRDEIRTGDLGFLDEQGNLVIRGRKNEMIKIFDQRVFPNDVANSVQEILSLSPVYIVVSDDDEPYLIAVLERAKTDKSAEELMQHIRQKLASYLVPKRLLLLDEIPATATGKIDASAIKALV